MGQRKRSRPVYEKSQVQFLHSQRGLLVPRSLHVDHIISQLQQMMSLVLHSRHCNLWLKQPPIGSLHNNTCYDLDGPLVQALDSAIHPRINHCAVDKY